MRIEDIDSIGCSGGGGCSKDGGAGLCFSSLDNSVAEYLGPSSSLSRAVSIAHCSCESFATPVPSGEPAHFDSHDNGEACKERRHGTTPCPLFSGYSTCRFRLHSARGCGRREHCGFAGRSPIKIAVGKFHSGMGIEMLEIHRDQFVHTDCLVMDLLVPLHFSLPDERGRCSLSTMNAINRRDFL